MVRLYGSRLNDVARWGLPCLAWVAAVLCPAAMVRGDFDPARYIAPDEVRPGMTGYGQTVMSGTKIERFEFEVISVMRNAWYAKKDVVLVRCSGLNLEHSGIIGGMSGSPCYVVDADGNERMLGAVAYGWSFNKDPICGVQPITQMIDVAETRNPDAAKNKETNASASTGKASDIATGNAAGQASGMGWTIGELIASKRDQRIPDESRLSVFNDAIDRAAHTKPKQASLAPGLKPLSIPVMVSGAHQETLELIQQACKNMPLDFVASGATTQTARESFGDVKLEPGSTICVPFMTGDLGMEGLGTCTEVVDGQVLGFGHALFAEGKVEYPMATGMVHTVIPSVSRSNKLGASLDTVGTLWGDEASAIYGTVGRKPRTIPFDVDFTDLRGERTYHYDMVHDSTLTPTLLVTALFESIMSNNAPPTEHTLTYQMEIEFDDLGTLRVNDMASMQGFFGLIVNVQLPVASLMDAPFGKAKVKSAKLKLKLTQGASVASIDEATISKTVFKPGETATINARWFHHYSKQKYTNDTYEIKLPDDLPDGTYQLSLTTARGQIAALQKEKPHLFRVENLKQTFDAYNMLNKFPQNRVYLRLVLPDKGVVAKRVELPELPSYRTQIFKDSQRSGLFKTASAKVEQYETDFAVKGAAAFEIKVDRRADQ